MINDIDCVGTNCLLAMKRVGCEMTKSLVQKHGRGWSQCPCLSLSLGFISSYIFFRHKFPSCLYIAPIYLFQTSTKITHSSTNTTYTIIFQLQTSPPPISNLLASLSLLSLSPIHRWGKGSS